MLRHAALVMVVAALVGPGVASASTASLAPATGDYSSGYTLFVAGGPGREVITVDVATDRATVTVTDSTGALAPGVDCAALDAHRALCTVPTNTSAVPGGLTHVDVRLGAGDDELRRVSDPSLEGLFVDGGPGDDILDASFARNVLDPRGHFGAVVLDGGPGFDVLRGGPADDTLRGGPGDDALHGFGGADDLVGGPGNDELDGGVGGSDLADYGARPNPVQVDLARGRGGGRDERDRYHGIEDVTGGSARDALLGDARANRLQGSPTLYRHRGPGDMLVGRGGNDQLLDFGGASRVDGGAGADELDGLGAGDTVSCGPGGDLVAETQPFFLVPRSCERLRTQFWDYGPPRVQGAGAVVRVTRPPGRIGTCRVQLSLRTSLGPVLGRATFTHAGRVVLRLSRAGRRAAARHAVVVLDAFERCGDTHDAWRVRL